MGVAVEFVDERSPQTKGPTRHQSVNCGQHNVISNCGVDSQQFDWGTENDPAKIIIVEIPSRIPRIVRREIAGFQHCVEIGKIHRFFTAHIGVPQVWVGNANE